VGHIVRASPEQRRAERRVRRNPTQAGIRFARRDQLIGLGFTIRVPHGYPTANDNAAIRLEDMGFGDYAPKHLQASAGQMQIACREHSR
jgi:hypothetical protein